MYKAIFLDLDGTLLDDNKNVSEENKKAIQYAKEKGVYVVLCSGRQKDAVKTFKEMADSSRYIISSNGAQIYDCEKNETLYTCTIDKDICEILVKYIIENKYFIRIENDYVRYVNSPKLFIKHEIVLDNQQELFNIINEDKIIQLAIGAPTKEEIYKVVDFIKSLNRDDIKIENVFPTEVGETKFWAANLINSNSSKGNAIYGLCKYLKIDINNVIAMGDDLNDLSMIKTVGLGVAMENALEEVKKVAKEITKNNNENGVAEIIKSKI